VAKPKTGPKILFLDIETAPNVVWSWGVYEENAIAVKEHWYVLSFAAKWRGAKKMIVKGLCSYPGYHSGSDCESDLLTDIHKLLDEADIMVAHNGRSFDIKKINARLIDFLFCPPSPYKVVDTKADLKKVASFASNKLNWLSKQLFREGKTLEHHDWKLWQGCMEGDKKSWKAMLEYNAHDVELLEQLYEALSPWLPQPNAALWGKGDVQCVNPACGSTDIQWRGVQKAVTRSYQRFQCQKCGAWGRVTHSDGGAQVTVVR
jgi:hypothetical protein